jgi:DNA-binding SARP family transcriptional activator
MRDDCLSVRLLGPLTVRLGRQVLPLHLAGVTRELLAHLLAREGHELRRDALADLFWEDADPGRARAAHSTAIWRIRKLLHLLPGLSLAAGTETLRLFAANEVVIDTRLLAHAVQAAAGAERAERPRLAGDLRKDLATAVDLYAGPFLDGSGSDWVMVERERLFNLQMRGLTLLMQDSGQRADYAEALALGHRILAADPFREQVQCEVMWLHVLSGQRVQALRKYHDYEAVLARELGIKPMPETCALYQHIRFNLDGDSRPNAIGRERPAVAAPIDSALSAIERSRRSLYDTLHTRLG